MRCPSCGVDDDRVIDSRPVDAGEGVRRRRSCNACGARFSTLERAVLAPLLVRKRSGEVRPFDREKVSLGVDRAANGRLAPEVVDEVAAGVERSLRSDDVPEVSSERVGLQVLAELKDRDPVAYVRFASVYKNFDGPEDFEKELVQLSKADPPKAS